MAEATHSDDDDTAEVERLRDESREKAREHRWKRASRDNDAPADGAEKTDGADKTEPSAYPVGDTTVRASAHAVNEFIIGLIEHKIAIDNHEEESIASVDLSDTELAVVQELSETIAGTILSDMERHLRSGGPRGSRETRANHFFCVVLAAICQVYEQLNNYASNTNSELAEIIVDLIELSRQQPKHGSPEPYPRTVEKPKGRGKSRDERHREDSFSLLPGERAFLKQVILKLLEAARGAAVAPIEKGVMLHLRVIASITCPDPDRHPSIIKYCIWPLLKGPLRELISDDVARQMEDWLTDTYPEEHLS